MASSLRTLLTPAGLKSTPAHGGPNVDMLFAGARVTLLGEGWRFVYDEFGRTGWLPEAALAPPPVKRRCLGWWRDPANGAGWDGSGAAYYFGQVGRHAAIMHIYVDLAHPSPDLITKLDEFALAGAVPLLSLELDDYTAGTNQPAYDNRSFQDATHDAVLDALLDRLAKWDKDFLLRFFWEMNYRDYPWAIGVNGNDTWSFVFAWRRLYTHIKARCPKARIVWCPGVSIPFGMTTEMEAFYPGPAFVDVVALDGYNKEAGNPQGASWSFSQVIKPSLQRLRLLNDTAPCIIAETGCAAAPGDRAAWLAQMGQDLATDPDLAAIDAVCFWNNKESGGAQPMDCRIEVDPATLAAFRTLAASPVMQGTWSWT